MLMCFPADPSCDHRNHRRMSGENPGSPWFLHHHIYSGVSRGQINSLNLEPKILCGFFTSSSCLQSPLQFVIATHWPVYATSAGFVVMVCTWHARSVGGSRLSHDYWSCTEKGQIGSVCVAKVAITPSTHLCCIDVILLPSSGHIQKYTYSCICQLLTIPHLNVESRNGWWLLH